MFVEKAVLEYFAIILVPQNQTKADSTNELDCQLRTARRETASKNPRRSTSSFCRLSKTPTFLEVNRQLNAGSVSLFRKKRGGSDTKGNHNGSMVKQCRSDSDKSLVISSRADTRFAFSQSAICFIRCMFDLTCLGAQPVPFCRVNIFVLRSTRIDCIKKERTRLVLELVRQLWLLYALN